MRNIVLLVAMVVAAISGYFVGGYRGRAAEEALLRANAAALDAKEEHQRALRDFNARLESLSAAYEQEKSQISADYERRKAVWKKSTAGRDSRETELTNVITTSQTKIAALEELLKKAADENERHLLAKEIARLQVSIKQAQATLSGFECSNVSVPGEMFEVLKESAQ